VAETLGVTEKLLASWRCRRTGPEFLLLGRRPRYRARAIQDYLDRAVVKTNPPGKAGRP
jgi:hypothetical protein